SQVDLERDGHLSDVCDVSVPIMTKGRRAATLHIGLSLTRYLTANVPRIRAKIVWFALSFSFFAILAAIKLSRSFTKPLQDLARELERVKRTSRPFTLIILDVDRFKRINDRYGHPVGDQVLQHIGRVARSVLRGYDVLARYGGEEFIAMLPDTAASQALLLGDRLRKMIEERPL